MARPRKLTKAEQNILDGAGRWQLKNGKFYDPLVNKYVIKCRSCKHMFHADRPHAKTCSELCRKRKNRAVNSGKKLPVFVPAF